MKEILLIGGGGHCHSVIDSIRSKNEFSIYGILDKGMEKGTTVLGVPVLGDDLELEGMFNKGIKYAFISVGSVGSTKLRESLYKRIKKIGFILPNIVDKEALLAEKVEFSEGCFVGKGAIINSNSVIGKNAIINTASVVEHDCIIGDFVHIATRAVLCGTVHVGKNAHIGANATIIQGINIGKDSLIGAGSVVTKDVLDNEKIVGNPGRKI